jgi:hypothetical protein
MPDEELNSLDRVRERLYRAEAPATFEEPALPARAPERATGWDKIKHVQREVRHEAQHISGPARFLIVALAFFLVTGGGALAYLIWGGRIVSTSNVNVAVQGPTTIASGDTVPLLVTIENRNPVAMHHATLTITFPDGTKSADDQTQPLTSYTEDLGDIPSGGKIEQPVRAALFGSEGQQVTLPITIEYRTDNSSAVFVKHKQYDFAITSSPISLSVTSLAQASAGQSVTVDVTVRSNATAPLDNVGIVATYPSFGFAYASGNPTPSTGSTFYLGTLAPGEERHISITGVVSGEENDERTFSFSAGTLTSNAAAQLATSYTTKEATMRLTKPFLATTLTINRDTAEVPVIQGGVSTQAVITWTNTLPTPVTNAHILVKLSGDALDPTTVASNGFYRSTDNTVLFDASTIPGLAKLEPGDSGQGIITFTPKRLSIGSSLKTPSLTFAVSVSGQRLSESNVPETLTSTLSRTAKVGTNLSLVSRIVHTAGPFKNSGPWPPAANSETTYTVLYTLSNAGNDVGGATITAALPSYVRFTGATSAGQGTITYDDTTRTVSWTVGDVPAGTKSVTAAFQIGFTPSITQSGTSPVLLFAQQVSGTDKFTQHSISGSVSELTTQTTSDPAYSVIDGNVK